ncbi:enoyl-CoA hydratase domain-containing protein 3, mitochondrial isoform X2 [Octopus bimaculoides]|uniref:Enoyl-CoA hydratase domain-containing protein 3, mitochondrial n=1 Tax=Octopus bimaculoides TaxID=37653 RepID=A0A0L8GS24_OCTBM|nr:enoyl-CoA hydratase domain-containing protein 3, mitochondrial isoform X2 [Octopus bimaculoides]|eukprot:XP_014778609.1 PREDICTED: enoyl-CoA hydratase domain-containing protein 3, mitochondrial-like [Octopus bimaculoides]
MAALFSRKCFRLLPTATAAAIRHSSAGARAEPLVLRNLENGILTLTLNNPPKRNALSSAMLLNLHKELKSCSNDDNVRVVLLTSKGDVFSSGHDLKELVITDDKSKTKQIEIFKSCSEVMCMIQDMAVPVIAQVSGLATAAGCQLVASCDIAIASEKAKFAVPGVNIGLFCTTPGVALGRAVPRKVAMEMLLTGQPISADEALRHGLISRVVSPELLEEETIKIAQRICEGSRSVLSMGKAAFQMQMNMDRDAAYYYAEKIMISNLNKEDGQEGIKSFLEKRRPQWCHK